MKQETLPTTHTDLIVAIVVCLVAALIGLAWIPLDVETGIFEKVRRKFEIGDAFAPAMATALLATGGVLLLVEAFRNPGSTRINRKSAAFMAILVALFAASFTVMLFAGSLAISLFGNAGDEYRLLRDTPPWKYLGFLLGGTIMVSALIGLVERRLTILGVLTGIGASLIIIFIYDLPFDDLLLPPNGDY
ncbi:MAG: hypothetical protein OXR62_10245 [Ahrensia sp.]|nr:hypothetical protein [Ahrensia sp.]